MFKIGTVIALVAGGVVLIGQYTQLKGEDLEKHVKQLTSQLANEDVELRAEATLQLIRIGKPALPVLKALTNGTGVQARLAREIMKKIEAHTHSKPVAGARLILGAEGDM